MGDKLQKLNHKNNILIVDDEADNLEVLSNILENKGYEVRQAINADIAFRAIKIQIPDLILLDILMPEINGYQVCQQLKLNPNTKDIPVIFLSALGRDSDKAKGFEIGGVDFISKPFHLEEALARVKHQLTIRKLQLELKRVNYELSLKNYRLQAEIYVKQQVENELKHYQALLETRNQELQAIVVDLKNTKE